jgi:uncharacterized protein YwqG
MHLANGKTWLRLFEDRQLDPSLAGLWASYARPNIRLMPTFTLEVDTTPQGSSKLGGEPDLPVGADWPTRPAYRYPRDKDEFRPQSAWDERPLNFVAQINLRDIASAGSGLPLPSSGLLLFFYDIDVQPWGFDPNDAPGWRVMHVGEGAPIKRRSNPAGGSSKTRPIELVPSEGLPGWEWVEENIHHDVQYGRKWFLEQLQKLTDDDLERISFGGHTFGGWPNLVQSPMELECEMVSNGLYAGSPEAYEDPRISEFRERASDWRLLLQINSDDDLDWMWGDSGKVYFLCREEDIGAQRFERAWTILQCT